MGFEGFLSRAMAENDIKERAKVAQIKQYLDTAPPLQTLGELHASLKHKKNDLVGLNISLEAGIKASSEELRTCDFVVLDISLSSADLGSVRLLKTKLNAPLLMPVLSCDEYSITQARIIGADGVIINLQDQSPEHTQMGIEIARDLKLESILKCTCKADLEQATNHDSHWLLVPIRLVKDELFLLSSRQVIVSDLIETQLKYLSSLKDKVLLGSIDPE